MVTEEPSRPEGVPLRELLDALDSAVIDLVEAPDGDAVAIGSVALLDGDDLAEAPAAPVDMSLLVGVREPVVRRWLGELAARPAEQRPRVVLLKSSAESAAVRGAARRSRVAVVVVHRRARWDTVLALVRRVLDRAGRGGPSDDPLDTDLFGLAQIVAQNAGGMVSIEDPHSHVLAYSASDESADELRILSILGREGPRDYLRVLQDWGVFDRLRRSDEVIDLPAHEELNIKRRLVVGIHATAADGGSRTLGSIWLQQGDRPFKPDAAEVLRGAAAVAARIIARALDAPSTETLLLQRLFGVHGEGVDIPSVAGALRIPVRGPAAVVGFALNAPAGAQHSALGSVIRLHASSFRPDSIATVLGDRIYVLLPGYRSASSVTAWTRQLVDQLEARRGAVLRAGIAIPVADLTQVAAARAEVDRVLDSTATTFPRGRVTTLAESRTAVLLGEILDLLAARDELHDPRLRVLFDYDRDHGSRLGESLEGYLREHGDVRRAAAALRVHPNTLRYRLRRAEALTGIGLADPADRLLLELQLALHRRGHRPA
ncbi:PucR family transcriptional regulator [Nocardia lijiangensis]|uniref:PucR family transcriptional regulator n=1 Tax=Nocardia lijiangensis TaxID=299618 RepID=UPI000AF77393|nr:helix-turn-helix domain-containing protein [Nocardia lijiangensis]